MLPYYEKPNGFRLAHELEGLLIGIKADGAINDLETARIQRWLGAAEPYRHLRPFREIAAKLDTALADGRLTIDECEDIIFVTQKLTTVNPHFNAFRSGVQVLIGVLNGIAADSHVNDAESARLAGWLDEWKHLRGLWPYDEVEAVVVGVMTERITRDLAKRFLLNLAQGFPIGGSTESGLPPLMISGVCAVDPDVIFDGRRFVFTGESERANRATLEQIVVERNGIPWPRVTQGTDYLVVCDCGSPFWAFACYGRKVEQAYALRCEGHPIVIALEADFWDAVASAQP